jgi:iron complex transport system ATP-binding protein
MIRCLDLTISRGGRRILKNCSFEAASGEVTCLIGPNGSGKTTLLTALAGLLKPDAGSMTIGRRIGFMPQEGHTPPALTVRQTVLLGRIDRLGLRLSDDDNAEAERWMERLDLSGLAARRLDQLSGGQRQLVYLAQTLLRQPDTLLLDEPTSALDLGHQLAFIDLIRALTRTERLTTIVAIHDIATAARIADRLVVITDGRISTQGSVRDVLTPSVFASAFGVDAELLDADGGSPTLRLKGKHQG